MYRLQLKRDNAIIDLMSETERDTRIEPDDNLPKRVRQIVDTSERIRQALKLKVLRLEVERHGVVTVSDFVNEVLEEALATELSEIDKLNAGTETKKKKKSSS